MFLEIILAGLVAYSAHSSANSAANNAANRISGEIATSTAYLDKRISQVEKKVDNLAIKIDNNQLELVKALTWHDYIQTMHIKGAKYKGDNLYVLKEKKITSTVNLVLREVKEVSGNFTLFKNFNDDTELLYYEDHLIYVGLANGEKKLYNDSGKVIMHVDSLGNTHTYLNNGLKESTRWTDGAIWVYKYNIKGEVIKIESYNMTPTSKKPLQPGEVSALQRWQNCMQANSMGNCMENCVGNSSWPPKRDYCVDKCISMRRSTCGNKPAMPM